MQSINFLRKRFILDQIPLNTFQEQGKRHTSTLPKQCEFCHNSLLSVNHYHSRQGAHCTVLHFTSSEIWSQQQSPYNVWLHCLHPSTFHCVSRITWSEVLLKPFNINLNRFYRFKSYAMWQSDMISKRAFAVLCWDCLSKGEREKDCI